MYRRSYLRGYWRQNPEDDIPAEPYAEDSLPLEDETVSEDVLRACAILRGEAEPLSDEPVGKELVALADYSASGRRREHWYSMFWNHRTGKWEYRGKGLRPITIRSADRHQSSYAPVYEGDLRITHDYGGPVNPEAYLYLRDSSSVTVPVTVTRDNRLVFRLPDGTKFYTPNPRRAR